MIPNLIWSVLFLYPIVKFCYSFVAPKTIYILLGVSLIPAFFPPVFFDLIQISRNKAFYERIGVKYINKFAQNGEFLNRYLRKKYPDFHPVLYNKQSAKKLYHQTYFFEKFHFSVFIFFAVITVYALVKRHPAWALVLSISNLFYNIYPNLLQQYLRLKLASVLKKINQDKAAE
jgi:Glycosyl-4,4'-diaponeurosporenoate acyltransferase